MDCNCNQNGRGYSPGMEQRGMQGNGRNMYYNRGQSNGRRPGCNQMMNGQMMSGVSGAGAMNRRHDGCNPANEPVDQMTIGMGYVPWQKWQKIYELDEALSRGTIFEELDKPYLGRPVK